MHKKRRNRKNERTLANRQKRPIPKNGINNFILRIQAEAQTKIRLNNKITTFMNVY